MPADNSALLGSIRVDIRADWSQLANDIAQAEQSAGRAGGTIAGAFTAGVRVANGLVDQFSVSLQGMAGSAGVAAGQNNGLTAAITRMGGPLTSTTVSTATWTSTLQGNTASLATNTTGISANTAALSANAAARAAAAAGTAGGGGGGAAGPTGPAGGAGGAGVAAGGAAAAGASTGFIRLGLAIYGVRLALRELDSVRQHVEDLQNLSRATGVTVERLAAFEGAINRAGGRGDQFGAVLARLARANASADEETKKMVASFHALGITAKDPIEQLYQMADAYNRVIEKNEFLGVAERLTGRSSIELAGILERGSAALRAGAQESSVWASAMSAAGKSADQFTGVIADLRQEISGGLAGAIPVFTLALQALGTAFILAETGAKAFYDVLVYGSIALDQAAGGNLTTARDALRQMGKELLEDSQRATEFLNKLYAVRAEGGAGGGTQHFTPPGTGGSAGRAAQETESMIAAHAARMLTIDRETADSQLAIQRGLDTAVIEGMTNRFTREKALAQEGVNIAVQRQSIMEQLDRKEMDSAIAALEAKRRLQASDGKTALAEIVKTNGEILAVMDRYNSAQVKLQEDVNKARAKAMETAISADRKQAEEALSVFGLKNVDTSNLVDALNVLNDAFSKNRTSLQNLLAAYGEFYRRMEELAEGPGLDAAIKAFEHGLITTRELAAALRNAQAGEQRRTAEEEFKRVGDPNILRRAQEQYQRSVTPLNTPAQQIRSNEIQRLFTQPIVPPGIPQAFMTAPQAQGVPVLSARSGGPAPGAREIHLHLNGGVYMGQGGLREAGEALIRQWKAEGLFA